jgi:hypothetical protein
MQHGLRIRCVFYHCCVGLDMRWRATRVAVLRRAPCATSFRGLHASHATMAASTEAAWSSRSDALPPQPQPSLRRRHASAGELDSGYESSYRSRLTAAADLPTPLAGRSAGRSAAPLSRFARELKIEAISAWCKPIDRSPPRCLPHADGSCTQRSCCATRDAAMVRRLRRVKEGLRPAERARRDACDCKLARASGRTARTTLPREQRSIQGSFLG